MAITPSLTMRTDNAVLNIRSKQTKRDIALTLKKEKERRQCDKLSFKGNSQNEIYFDLNDTKAFVDLLLSGRREWKSIEFRHCTGRIDECTTVTMSLDQTESFRLVCHKLDTQSFFAIRMGLQISKSLKRLTLSTRFNGAHAMMIANGLSESQCLEVLDISGSVLDKDALKELQWGLGGNISLRAFKMNSCNLGDEGISKLISSLIQHPSLRELAISKNRCSMRGTLSIASLLFQDRLTHLDLSYQTCREEGNGIEITVLTGAIRASSSLRWLNLAGNDLNGAVAASIFVALQESPCHLEIFDLSNNVISDVGMAMVASTLQAQTKISKLLLWHNPFELVGTIRLLEAVRCNNLLDIEEVAISSPKQAKLAQDKREEYIALLKQKMEKEINFSAKVQRGLCKLAQTPSTAVAIWPHALARISQSMFRRKNTRNSHGIQKGLAARRDIIFTLLRQRAVLEVILSERFNTENFELPRSGRSKRRKRENKASKRKRKKKFTHRKRIGKRRCVLNHPVVYATEIKSDKGSQQVRTIEKGRMRPESFVIPFERTMGSPSFNRLPGSLVYLDPSKGKIGSFQGSSKWTEPSENMANDELEIESVATPVTSGSTAFKFPYKQSLKLTTTDTPTTVESTSTRSQASENLRGKLKSWIQLGYHSTRGRPSSYIWVDENQ